MALEPITRAEQIMSGEGLTPITREEMFLAKAAGRDVETPPPITRREMFLSKISGGSGGGTSNPVIHALEVTENGTYEAPNGVDGYSPVTVNVAAGGSSGDEWFNDGNTHIWITLSEGRTSPMLGVCPNGTVTVDWGDGTTPDTLTGTNIGKAVWTPRHEYAKAGDYVITLTVDGEMKFMGNNDGGYILRHSTGGNNMNKTYINAIRRAEIGNGVTGICQYMFINCHSIASVVIPDSVTVIGNNSFMSCYSLTSIVIPGSVTALGTYAFMNCYGVRYYDFTNHTAVPTLPDTNVFGNYSSDLEIRVPAALYDEWIAATNWATYASYIKAV